jgi:hypothetical protein
MMPRPIERKLSAPQKPVQCGPTALVRPIRKSAVLQLVLLSGEQISARRSTHRRAQL